MANVITLDNTITFEGSGRTTLDGLIIETINRDDIMPDYKQYTSLLNYTEAPLLNPDQTFAAKSAPKSMDNVTETGLKKQANFLFQPKKGVYQQEVGQVFTMSYYYAQWIRQGQNIKNAPSDIQAKLTDVAEQTRDLVLAYDMRRAEELVKVIAKGFSVTAANWPGSATPKWNPLYYASQPYGDASIGITGTFSNIVTGATYTDTATGIAQLQDALDKIKATRDDNGKFIREPKEGYFLYVSRTRMPFWSKVLNVGSNWVNSNFSGQGTNANQNNQFNFQGNTVTLVQLDLLGQPDYTGTAIGSADNAFLMNREYIKQTKALRTYNLYAPKVKNYDNNETDEISTSFRWVFGMDHYGAELGIVWIQGS